MSSVKIERMAKPADLLPTLREFESLIAAVEKRAYHLFEKRGRRHGSDLDDWLTAERQLLGTPYTECSDEETRVRMRVAVPGFSNGEITVIASTEELIVRAVTGPSDNQEAFNMKAMCHLRFPEPIDLAKLTADMIECVIEVTAPKAKRRASAAI